MVTVACSGEDGLGIRADEASPVWARLAWSRSGKVSPVMVWQLRKGWVRKVWSGQCVLSVGARRCWARFVVVRYGEAQ